MARTRAVVRRRRKIDCRSGKLVPSSEDAADVDLEDSTEVAVIKARVV